MGKLALVVGGGAPNMPLMAGAMVAMLQRGVQFDLISTSGAGALVGLLAAAPRCGDPIAALAGMVDMGVADAVYRAFPVNFKVFQKPGLAADEYRTLTQPWQDWINRMVESSPMLRTWADWQRLALAGACPSDLSPSSQGLCAHVPFIEEVVDFDRLSGQPVVLNAYNLTRRTMVQFHAEDITAEHFRAALSFPFLYPPTALPNEQGEPEYYIEGAALDTLNFAALVGPDGLHPEIDAMVVFDVLGAERLLRPPRDLYDAWVMSIITPLVEIARDDLKLFDLVHNRNADGSEKRPLLKVPLLPDDLPEDVWLNMFDWNESNMRALFARGYNAGLTFCEEHAAGLRIEAGSTLAPLPASWTLADVVNRPRVQH
ncbi:patatin-like phospholipase family protein [Chitinibacteraceae bacterium HSL-7]